MVTARGRRELARTASWSSVRSGLSWLIGAWLVLTLGSVGVQLQNMQLAPGIAAKDPGALIVMTVVSAGYQLFYVLVSVALVVALVRLTRVPPSSRAVTPAVVATFSFVLVGLASLVLLLGMGSRSSEAISERELWLLAAVARTAGLLALGLALTRMAATLRVRLPPAAVGATFAFVLIDTAFPLHRLLTILLGEYGRSKAGRTSFETLGGDIQLLTDKERQFTYYNLALGYNFLPGEVFLGRGLAMTSTLYVTAGIGNTEFAGDDHVTLNLGCGYRVLPTDWLSINLGLQAHMFNSDLLGTDKLTSNLQGVIGVTAFF